MRSWLKEQREKRKLTQTKVALNCNISRSYYTHIENGTKTPTVEVAKNIANELGFEWTLFFEEQCHLKGQNEKPA